MGIATEKFNNALTNMPSVCLATPSSRSRTSGCLLRVSPKCCQFALAVVSQPLRTVLPNYVWATPVCECAARTATALDS